MFDIGTLVIFFSLYGLLVCLYPLFKNFLTSAKLIGLYTLATGLTLIAHTSFGTNIFFSNTTYQIGTSNLLTSGYVIPLAFSFALTQLSWLFMLLVLIIAFATNIYLLNYFKGESRESLFACWLNGFVFSMLILILSNNFFTLFLGWECIGLTSFFLINFWHTRRGTVKASFKAFTYNTFSDLCLLLAITTLFSTVGTDEIDILLYLLQTSNYDENTLYISASALVLCAASKSVQFGLHLWLPDSMEAPVPASALIHSATLVSAGIYLLLRFHVLFLTLNLQSYLILWGSVTALVGGLSACAQTDLKKLLAYSTMSHCGFLWGLASLGDVYTCTLYLFLHGLFKAATFFAAGSFIQLFGTQDMRWMRGGNNLLLDSLLLFLTSANLSGLPLTVGYFYKEALIKALVSSTTGTLCISGYVLAMLTSIIYFLRLNSFWLFGFNRTVKNDVASIMHLNKTQKVPGFTQLNVVFAIFFIFVVSICFTKIWDIFGQPLFLVDSNAVYLDGAAAKRVDFVSQFFYWCFGVVSFLFFIFQLKKTTGLANHALILFTGAALLVVLVFNIFLAYVSLHYDWSFISY